MTITAEPEAVVKVEPILQNKNRIGVSGSVESERSRQLGRRIKTVDAGRQDQSTEILTTQVGGARLAGQGIVGYGGIDLGLRRNRIAGVYRSGQHPRRKACYGSARANAQIA